MSAGRIRGTLVGWATAFEIHESQISVITYSCDIDIIWKYLQVQDVFVLDSAFLEDSFDDQPDSGGWSCGVGFAADVRDEGDPARERVNT